MTLSLAFRQTQLVFVAINYGLVCWQIVQLKDEGSLGLFIFLLAILSIERILITLKSIFILIFGMEYCAIPISILTNICCCDLSLGYDLDDDDLYFFNKQFSRQINYTVHYLNLVPLIICFVVSNIKNEEPQFLHPVYWILIIYGLIHVSACIWRFIEGICRFGCFCACVGELLSVSLWFLWLAVLVVSFEILVKFYLSRSCYFFFTFFQIQLLSSYESMKYCHKNAEFYLITNAFQAVFLTLLFILRTSLHPEFQTYDILIYASFAIIFPQGLSSIYFLFNYIRFGPFSKTFNLKQHGINPEQQKEKLKIDQQKILQATEEHVFFQNLRILIYEFNEEILSKKQLILFDFEILKAVAKRKSPLSSCIVNNGYFQEFNIFQDNVEFQFNDPFDLQKAQDIIVLILDLQLQGKSKMEFTLRASSMIKYELTRIFLQKTYFANPTIFQITPRLEVDLHKKLFLDMLKFIANQKMIFPFLPINQGAYMFDLYEDYLSTRDL